MLQNFKACKNATYTFDGKNVTVCGANGSGKTTIFDAFTWLLFGKDSLDNAKFEIRPLDKDGKQIDNVEICVSATLDIDGKEVELKKTQKQNWVKKRGTQNPVLQGNVNEYEIDGYPRSAKDYEEYINGIVSDDLFKMLTNPTYFPNMPWKDQRATIMKFASDVSDVELATEDSRFAELLPEIEKAPSTDDIKNKYQKSLNELKKNQIELPVRIDEISNSKVDIDVAELELQRNALREKIAENKAKQEDVSKQYEEYQKFTDGIMELKFAESDLVRKANEENIKKRRELDDKITDIKYAIDKCVRDCDISVMEIDKAKKNIESYELELKSVRDLWKSLNAMQFDKDEENCQMCGQKLPQEKIDILISDFEERKAKSLADTTERGNKLKALADSEKERLKKLNDGFSELTKEKVNKKEELLSLEKQLSELPISIDVTGTEEYKAIQSQIAEKKQAMSQMNSADEIRQQLKSESDDLQSQLMDCEKQIALSQRNIEIDERIEELQAEQREVAQKIADVEKMLFLLDEFIKYKLDKISDSINSQFEMVNFILFKSQLNGGIAETCECQYNGIPYGSLNSAARIQCGLDIIRTLQRMYGVFVPVFVDNRESCTNIPTMDCQVISLVVSPTDKDLRIVTD
jgi:DNA repair exonuclease SbcCD ATPase subunit